MRCRGDFPKSYKIGGAVRVRREDFLTWIESKRETA
ncbi:helix-turn-helix transcriptional regulator [Rhodococcus rhodochrous]